MREFKRVPVEWLKPGPLRAGVTESYLHGLGASLEVRQLQPIGCFVDGKVLYGNTRAIAAKLRKLSHLDALVTDEKLTPAEILVIYGQENLLRVEMTNFEKTHLTLRLKELGLQQKEIAEQLHVDESLVTKLMSYMNALPAIQEAYRDGAIGIGDLYSIARADEGDQLSMLADRLGGNCTREDLQHKVRRKRGGSSVKVSRVRIPLPSGVSVLVTGGSVGFDEVIEALAEAIKQAKKALADKLDVKTWQAVMSDKAKA